MYIAATALSMDASQTYKEVEQRVSGLTNASTPATGQSDTFGIRLASTLASARQTQISSQSEICRSENSTAPAEPLAPGTNQAKTTLLSQMTRQVTGQSVTIRALQDTLTTTSALRAMQQEQTPLARQQTVSFTSGRVYSEATALLFSAQGTVQTLDGREINFDLGLSMEQSTVAVETASFATSGLFIDPLILQFDTQSPLLADSSFLFDIDGDGKEDDLACPGSGCGFLAFDRNGDGKINDGSELFGPESGSGFGELAALDSDANLWIDENDPMFDQLLIWSLNGQDGGEKLCSLKEAGVGAIAVAHAGTDFQLRQEDGSVVGTIAANGLFLTENGEVRPMQEVELALAENPSEQLSPGAEKLTWAQSRREEQTMQALREIISFQRLRLKMMLTGQRLRFTLEEQSQQKIFFDWLHRHQQWDNILARQSSQEQSSRSAEQAPSPAT